MMMIRKILSNRRVRILLGVMLVALAIAGVVTWRTGVDLASLKGMWKITEAYLKLHPLALFLALVFLPGLPIPTSALLLTAGVVWREQPAMACLVCLLALILNLTWTYWLAAGPARRLIEKLLAATGIQIPQLPRGDHLKLILVMRLTPGIPLFLQNYLLGFLRAPFALYLPISILCSGVIATGIVLSGAGLSNGSPKGMIVGMSLISASVIFTHLIRSWLAKKKLAKGSDSEVSL